MNCDHSEDAVPSNAIATTALNELAEYAGGERLYAVLFDDDYDAMNLDANGDLALLVDAEQAAVLRDQFAEIAAALDRSEQSEAELEQPDIDIRDAPRLISDEWSRRTWYGKLHVLLWEAVGMTVVLALISVIKILAVGIEAAEENWPSKYKEADNVERRPNFDRS